MTSQMVRSFLYGKILKDIPYVANATGVNVNGVGEWSFEAKEIIEIDIVETIFQGNLTVVVVQVKTGDAPGLQVILYDANNNILGRPLSSPRTIEINFWKYC